jgi:hypothetical protein
MDAKNLRLVFGPQGEKIVLPEAEARAWEAAAVETFTSDVDTTPSRLPLRSFVFARPSPSARSHLDFPSSGSG